MARYRIDPERSRVVIDASSSVHPIHSVATGLEGWVEVAVTTGGGIDTDAPAAAHLELPVARLRSGNPLEEAELKRRIDTRKFPTIDGDLTSMTVADGDGRYRVAGDVTFRGVTRPCADEMTIAVEPDGSLLLQGSSEFDVRDFGMRPPRILLFRVHPEVTVSVDITAVPERDLR